MTHQISWRLRNLMAERDMFQTTDLIEPLRSQGVTLSRERIFRLVTRQPQRLDVEVLAAQIATAYNSPPVTLSNSGVEAEIIAWVSKVTTRRGAMFTNLPRTNLLGDLVVTGSAGLLADTHRLATLIRDASRRPQGWAPPPRALAEPAGVMALRDPMSVAALLELAGT